MRSAKIIYLSSLACGIILFIIGIGMLMSIRSVPDQKNTDVTQASSDTNSFDIIDNYKTNTDSINFLVMIKEASGANIDSIIIANYSPETRQINLLTVPRDTKVSADSLNKINSYFDIGLKKYKKSKDYSLPEKKHKAAEYTSQTISNLTGIKLDYYVYLEIDTIKGIIDKLGGINFDVPAKLKYNDPTQDLYIDLQPGYQLLDGDKAEQLLRFRKAHTSYYTSKELREVRKYYDGSDLKRTEMQIKFINAMIEQKVNLFELPKLIPIINYTFDNVITNTSLNDVLSLFRAFTQGSRPDMNTFKLSGIDKRISGADFIIYNNRIEDTKSKKLYKDDEIIEKYFSTPSGNFLPDTENKYDYDEITKDNPSNSETDTEADGGDKP